MRKDCCLTIGTDSDGMGGIATVLKTYASSGFFTRWGHIHIKTHSSENSNNRLSALLLYVSAVLLVIYYGFFRNVKLAHVHMASRGSYTRKSFLIRILKKLKIPVILHLHGAEFREFYDNECSAKKKAHIRATFGMVDFVVVLSTQWLAWLKSILSYSEHVRIIYNSVECLTLNRERQQEGLIVFLGRLGDRKGVADLIQAFSIVYKKYPHVRLAIGGDGDIEKYQKLAHQLGLNQCVEFLGWVSGEAKIRLLEKADVFCLPSYNEGFPMGVLEAMSAGVAVVASRAGGIPDAIDDGLDGLLVDAGDIDTLADSLTKLIVQRDLNNKITLNARSKFDLHFSLNAILPKLDALYADVFERNR